MNVEAIAYAVFNVADRVDAVRDAPDEGIMSVGKVGELVQNALGRHEVTKVPAKPVG